MEPRKIELMVTATELTEPDTPAPAGTLTTRVVAVGGSCELVFFTRAFDAPRIGSSVMVSFETEGRDA